MDNDDVLEDVIFFENNEPHIDNVQQINCDTKTIDDELVNKINRDITKIISDANATVPDKPTEDKKKRIPSKFLANQQKYLSILDKQNKKPKTIAKKPIIPVAGEQKSTGAPEGMRRVLIGTTVKYIPIKPTTTQDSDEPVTRPVNRPVRATTSIDRPVKSCCRSSTATGCKIPPKYGQHIDNNIKKETIKNAKNFSDLRRIKALENIASDSNVDVSKASIVELRKLRVEQRTKDQVEAKRQKEKNTRETAVQKILENNNMSKFSKVVAIKNLSANSRHQINRVANSANNDKKN